MTETTNYSLNVVEGSDLFNPLTQFNPNFTQIDSIMFDNEKAGVAEATELKSGTTHALIRDNTNRQIFVFTATSDYEAGDTFTVDGNIVTAKLPSGESLGAGAFVVNSTVLCSIVGSLLTVYTSKGGTTTATDSERLGGELPAYYATAEELMATDAKADSAASVAQSANAISIQNQSAIQGLSGQLTTPAGAIYMDYQNGEYGYNTSPTKGADTFFPFKSGGEIIDSGSTAYTAGNSFRYKAEKKCIVLLFIQGVPNTVDPTQSVSGHATVDNMEVLTRAQGNPGGALNYITIWKAELNAGDSCSYEPRQASGIFAWYCWAVISA